MEKLVKIPKVLPLWIGGEEIISEKKFKNTNPFDQSLISEVCIADQKHIEKAIQLARNAQIQWAKKKPKERANVLRKAAAIMRANNDQLAEVETQDTGRPIRETTVVDIVSAADCLEYICSLIETRSTRHIPLGEGTFAYTLEKPLGVCLGIGAWNYPLQVAVWKSAPALACGNSFIFKPSEFTPTTAYFLAKAYQEAGLPKGLFQVLQGDGSVGKALVENPGIAKVSLTGSIPTGKAIYRAAATDLKKISLELGGKGPLIIFDDADLSGAVQAALLANFYSQGEVCSNGTRVFIHESIQDKFTKLLLAECKKIIVGNPSDPQTHMGPMISTAHKEKVLQAIEKAQSEGASLLCGGSLDGSLIAATILGDCHDEMDCVKNEIFGPVLSLLSFKDESEVITRANASPFGLAGGVFTKDLARGHRMAQALEVGVSWVNSYNLTPVEMPFGGTKESGLGMENGHEVLKEYTRSHAIYINSSGEYDSFF
jgi:betaine-aldehyde dehydrogenase